MFGSVSKTIKFQSTETYLIVSLKAKDQINEKQLQFLNESKDKGFLSLRWEKNAAGNKLRYDISNLVVCSEYIKQPRTLEEYFGLIYQFQQMMDFCEKSYLQSGCLVVSEAKDVYCDPKTKRLYAAFLPLLDSHCNCSHPVHFLRDLHKHSNLLCQLVCLLLVSIESLLSFAASAVDSLYIFNCFLSTVEVLLLQTGDNTLGLFVD